MPQPTLPDVSLDEDDYNGRIERKLESSDGDVSDQWDDTGIYPGGREIYALTAVDHA